METETNATIDSWDNIVTNFLRPDNFADTEGSFLVEGINITQRKGNDGVMRNQLELLVTHEGTDYVFPLNWTNTKKVKELVEKPKELIQRKLSYQKIKVTNPQTKEIVDSIAITGLA